MNISIARALKEKARLINRINEINALVCTNSHDEKEQVIDLRKKFEEREELVNKLVDIKAKISIANNDIVSTIYKMEEAKGFLNILKQLNTKEGEITQCGYDEPTVVKLVVFFNVYDVAEMKEKCQKMIEEYQDQIDEYNASHFISID